MTNKQLLNKIKNDMKIRNFSHYTYELIIHVEIDIAQIVKIAIVNID